VSSADAILRAIDQTKVTAVVYLGMSKAFGSIKHEILLNKLKNIGLSSCALRWFCGYLSQRSQVVHINSTLSDAFPVVCGVLQGSVLGALLFSIYANDLQQSVRDAQPSATLMILNFFCHSGLGMLTKQRTLSMMIYI